MMAKLNFGGLVQGAQTFEFGKKWTSPRFTLF